MPCVWVTVCFRRALGDYVETLSELLYAIPVAICKVYDLEATTSTRMAVVVEF